MSLTAIAVVRNSGVLTASVSTVQGCVMVSEIAWMVQTKAIATAVALSSDVQTEDAYRVTELATAMTTAAMGRTSPRQHVRALLVAYPAHTGAEDNAAPKPCAWLMPSTVFYLSA